MVKTVKDVCSFVPAGIDANDLYRECLSRARQRFSRMNIKPIPPLFDMDDIESYFGQGWCYGLQRVDWSRGDPLEYLVQSGIWNVRTARYRTMGKLSIIICSCGQRVKWGDKPCHYADGSKNTEIVIKKDPKNTSRGKNPYELSLEAIYGCQIYVAELATDLIEKFSESEKDEEIND